MWNKPSGDIGDWIEYYSSCTEIWKGNVIEECGSKWRTPRILSLFLFKYLLASHTSHNTTHREGVSEWIRKSGCLERRLTSQTRTRLQRCWVVGNLPPHNFRKRFLIRSQSVFFDINKKFLHIILSNLIRKGIFRINETVLGDLFARRSAFQVVAKIVYDQFATKIAVIENVMGIML